jgi:ABC-type molybdate transport system permease subunit
MSKLGFDLFLSFSRRSISRYHSTSDFKTQLMFKTQPIAFAQRTTLGPKMSGPEKGETKKTAG